MPVYPGALRVHLRPFSLGFFSLANANVRDRGVFVLLQELLKLSLRHAESDVHRRALRARRKTFG
jgi:hypothetical protein